MPYPCTNVPLIRIGVPCHTETNQTSKTLDGLRLKFPSRKRNGVILPIPGKVFPE